MNNPQELTEQEKKLLVQAQSQYPSGVGEVNAQFATQSGQDFREIMGGSIGQQMQEDGSRYAMRNMILQGACQLLTVEQRIAQAVLEERERCAKIAEHTTERPDEWNVPGLIAERIRSGK